MLKSLLLILAGFTLTCCNDKNRDVNLQQGLKNDSTVSANQILMAEPRIIDSSHIIIYPLILEKTSYGDSYSDSYGSRSGGERTSYWNLIFYNTETGQQHLLTADKKMIIYTIHLSGYSSSSSGDISTNGINIFKNSIIYTAVAKDYNLNNQLDQYDPDYLYISDKEGNNFRQISPEDYNILSWHMVAGTAKIIMQGQKDENGDKKFDAADKTIPLVADVTLMKPAVETFNNNYIDSLKQKLVTIWKPVTK